MDGNLSFKEIMRLTASDGCLPEPPIEEQDRIAELESILAEVEAELIRSAACSHALLERVKAVREAVR